MISLINNMMRSSSGHYTIDASKLIVTEILSGNIDCVRVFPITLRAVAYDYCNPASIFAEEKACFAVLVNTSFIYGG